MQSLCLALQLVLPKYSSSWGPTCDFKANFTSKSLLAVKYNYNAPEYEFIALIKTLKYWWHYIMGRHFIAKTDQ